MTLKTFSIPLLLLVYTTCIIALETCSHFDMAMPSNSFFPACNQGYMSELSHFKVFNYESKQLTATFQFEITSLCGATSERTFYSLNAYNRYTSRKVFGIKARTLTTFTSYIIDINGNEKELSTITTGSWIKWIIGAVAIDLATNKVNMLWMSPSGYISASENNFNFGNLVWKPTPLEPQLMYMGVDYPNKEYTAFIKRSTLFGDEIESNLFPFVLGSRTPVLIGMYPMFENSGYAIKDTLKTVGPAYFGESTRKMQSTKHAPEWTPFGVRFTEADQYIKLPQGVQLEVGDFSLGNPLTSSLTITFSVKLDTVTTGQIFTRLSPSSQVVIGLNINSAGKLDAIMNNTVLSTSSTVLGAGKWYQITVFFVYTEQRATSSISFGDTVDTINIDNTPLKPLTLTESKEDVFKIGGFKGTMKNLLIFAPGTARLSTKPCSPTCSLDIGVISATCIIPKCRPDQYVSGNSCEQCHASCQTCGGPGPNACLSCYSSIKLSNTNSCPGSKGKQVDETLNGSLTGGQMLVRIIISVVILALAGLGFIWIRRVMKRRSFTELASPMAYTNESGIMNFIK